jgi:MFS family permease
MALASLVSPPVARWLAERIGVRQVLPLGALVVAAAFGLYAGLHHHVWQLVLMMAVMGIGIGITYSVLPAIIVARTPVERTASATGTNQVLRLLGGSIGAAVTAAVLAWATPAAADAPGETGYVVAALVATAMGCCTAVVGWLLVPNRLVEPRTVDRPVPPELT